MPLAWAADSGHQAVVQLLLATDGVDVDPKDADGRTLLSFGVENGQETVVKLLATATFGSVSRSEVRIQSLCL